MKINKFICEQITYYKPLNSTGSLRNPTKDELNEMISDGL